jgi:zinc and cadmium transporter
MVYALIVSALSLAGALLPLRRTPTHAQLQLYLSMAAGALLGAALFHLLPESSHHIHASFGLPAVLGIAVVFLLQRYLAPHSHEAPASAMTHAHGHSVLCEHGHEHRHDHSHDAGHHPAPGKGGLVGVVALSIHSFFDGVAIGAVTFGGVSGYAALAVFLSVLIHKPMDGLSVSVLLLNARVKRGTLWSVQVVYALLVPVGALAFYLSKGSVADTSALVGYTMAFSAGTFLAIALTDLLPEIHFHTHDRHKLSGAVVLGLAVMWLTSQIGHSNGHHHGPAPSGDSHDHAPGEPAHDHSHDGHSHDGHSHHDHDH